MLTIMIGIHKNDKYKIKDYAKRIDAITKHYDIDNDKVGSITQGMVITIPEIMTIMLEKFDNSDEFEHAYLNSVVDIAVSDNMYTYFADSVIDDTSYKIYDDEAIIEYISRIIDFQITKKAKETMSYSYNPTRIQKSYSNKQEYEEAVSSKAKYAAIDTESKKKTEKILYTITLTTDSDKYEKHKSEVDKFIDKMITKKGVKSITTTISYVE